MNKKIICLLLGTLAAVSFVGCSNSTQPTTNNSSVSSQMNTQGITITQNVEGIDYDITYDKVPQRAVSLSSWTTEMMLALGLEESMVGTAYQDNEILPEFKDAYNSVPSLSEANVSREKMVATAPDFLTGWASDFKEKNHNPKFCEENGIKMYVPKCENALVTMDTVYEDFTNLGKIFQVENRATQIIKTMKSKIEDIENKLPKEKIPKVFIYESGADAPYTPVGALPSEIVKKAGGQNIFADSDKAWATVGWEDVVANDPDYIVVMKYDSHDDYAEKMDTLHNNPALRDITAIKENNIIEIPAADLLPGVRNVRAIEQLAKAFHPEVFND